MRRLVAAALLAVLAGCTSGGPQRARSTPPTAAMISRAAATAICPLVDGKVYPLQAMHGDVDDAYVWVRECHADVRGEGVALHASAAVWMVVDRDIGPIHLEQFVQGTVSLDVVYAVTASYENAHAEVTLRPLAPPRSGVEAVGLLDPQPLNWAALAAETFVPSLGTTSEWMAKGAARAEAVKALGAVLGRELRVGLDAQRDRLWVGAAAPAGPVAKKAGQTIRVAASGTALVGPFLGDVALKVSSISEHRHLAAKAICPRDVERILALDRRAEVVDTSAWIDLESGASITVNAPPSCEWMLALRARGAESSTVALEAQLLAKRRPTADDVTTAVSIESIAVEPSLVKADIDLWLVGGDERVRIFHARLPFEPHVFILSAGEKLTVQATLRGDPHVLSEVVLPLSEPGERKVVIADHEGNPSTVSIRARVFAAPRLGSAGLRP